VDLSSQHYSTIRKLNKHPKSTWFWFHCASRLISILSSLISHSPDPEVVCTAVRTVNPISAFQDFLAFFETVAYTPEGEHLVVVVMRLMRHVQSLLCLLATPFVGASAASNTNYLSLLKEYGRPCEETVPCDQGVY
jgi:hypothetical protein